MNILFLDDNPHRTKRFLSAYPSAETVETAEACIEKLKKKEYHVVLLDHDLGGEAWVDSSRDDTGMAVVRWIQKNKPEVQHFIVHSHNTPAGEEMKAKLLDLGYAAEYKPFIKLFSDYDGV